MPRVPYQEIQGIDLDQPFTSHLPERPDLEAAFLDPVTSQWLDPNNPMWGERLTRDGFRLAKVVAGLSATTVGVQSKYIPDLNAITTSVMDRDWLTFTRSSVEAGLDIAFAAVGAVPIVGALAKAALNVVTWIIDAAQAREERPPQRLAQYSKQDNVDATNTILDKIGAPGSWAPDWTPIFMPPAIGTWRRVQTGDGYLFEVDLDHPNTVKLGGDGLVPGRIFGVSQIQVSDFAIRHARFSTGGGMDILVRGISDMTSTELAAYVRDSVWDKWSVRPSATRAAAAAWQMVQTRTAALFNINTEDVADAWKAYVDNGLDLMNQYEQSEAESRKLEQAKLDRTTAYAASTAFYDLPRWQDASDLSGKEKHRADYLAKLAMQSLRHRQMRALDTYLVAYATEDQAAFKNASLLKKLRKNRELLLEDAAVMKLVPADVIDDDYREKVVRAQARGTGFGFTAQPGVAKTARSDWNEDQVPEGETWDAASSGGRGSGLTGILLIAGALYGGYRAAKYLRKK